MWAHIRTLIKGGGNVIRIEAKYVGVEDWNGEDLYTYRLRFIDTTTIWGNLPPFSGWGTLLGEYEPNEANRWEIVEHIPRTLEPPHVETSPPSTPTLYLVGLKIDGVYLPVPIPNYKSWKDSVLYHAGVRLAYGYYVSTEPYRDEIIPPGTEFPSGWYPVGGGNLKGRVPDDEFLCRTTVPVFARNSQRGWCEYYPELMACWAGAIPGVYHFLANLDDDDFVTQHLESGWVRRQNLETPWHGRSEYLLNESLFSLPGYVEYEHTYLPPIPGYGAGEYEVWSIELMVPCPGEEPVFHHDPEPEDDDGVIIPDDLTDDGLDEEHPIEEEGEEETLDKMFRGSYGIIAAHEDRPLFINEDILMVSGETLYG